MSLNTEITAYFVRTHVADRDGTRGNATQDMDECLNQLQKVISEKQIKHIKASEGFALIAAGKLTKRDVFIFDHFEGDFFTQLQQTNAVILGPRCITTCLLKDEPIPSGNSPIYTVAMRGMQISASGVNSKEKEQLRQLIQWMGGYYFSNLGRQVTHLISNTIMSPKYEQATLHGIPVWNVDWVQRVWQRSCVDNVLASDEEFSKYRLPIFYRTNITCTGLRFEQKEEVKRLIKEHGGTYHRAFRSDLVDIVIMNRDATITDKYQAAVHYNKAILATEWIFKSVEKGYALPTKLYQVKALKAATPTKSKPNLKEIKDRDTTLMPNLASKTVLNSNCVFNDTVNETFPSSSSLPLDKVKSATEDPGTAMTAFEKNDLQYRTVLDKICLKKAKEAGNFLNGCCIYLSGFRAEEKTKLDCILKVSGAKNYDFLNGKITHIIVGQLDNLEMIKFLKNDILSAVHVVHLDWLLESITLQQPASETVHLLSSPDTTFLSFKQPEAQLKKKPFDNTVEFEFPFMKPLASSTELPLEDQENKTQCSQEYRRAAMPLKPTNATAIVDNVKNNALITKCTQMLPIDYENLNFLHGMFLYVHKTCFSEQLLTQVLSSCEAAQGNVVSSHFRGEVDFAIVSFEFSYDINSLPIKARHIVTELYIEDCMKRNELVRIEYFHRHIPITADVQPLQGMTVVISIYTNRERDFIESTARLLGALVNDNFVKKERPLLVCPIPQGQKYNAALKWCYPVVVSAWLVQCAAKGCKLPYNDFLVGDCARDFDVYPPSLLSINSSQLGTSVTAGVTPPAKTRATRQHILEADEQCGLLPVYTTHAELRQHLIPGMKRHTGASESDDDEKLQTLKKSVSVAGKQSQQTFSGNNSLNKRRRIIEDNSSLQPADFYVSNTQSSNGIEQMIAAFGKSNFKDPTLINSSSISDGSAKLASKSSTPTLELTNSPLQQITEYLKKCKSHRESLQHSPQTVCMQPRVMSSKLFESEGNAADTEEMVGWRDPAEFTVTRRARGAAMMQYKGTPLFSISCGDDKHRQDIIGKILKLGGKVCENLINYDPACTHFLCERPNRGEKILGCISTGKWVLSLQYIEESFAKDAFVDEELFEWGNSKALNLRQLKSDEQSVALAANCWRKMLATRGNKAGAFDGFRVILRLPEKNLEAIKNVIRAGKGEVIDARPPYSEKNGAHLANYCFVDSRKAPLTREDYNFLCSKGVKVYSQLFINGYLMNCGKVDDTKYEIKMTW